MWANHLLHLAGRSWQQVLAWRSATTFSLLLEITVPVLALLVVRLRSFGWEAWRQVFSVTEGMRSVGWTVVVLLAIAVLVFVAAIPVVVYQDHEGLVYRVQNLRAESKITRAEWDHLRQQNEDLSQRVEMVQSKSGAPKPSWQRPANGQGGPIGPILAVELVQTFKDLPQPCAVRVTAASDKSTLKSTLSWLLTTPQRDGGAGCTLWTEPLLHSTDDPELPKQAAIAGVAIHWESSFRDGERIAHFLDADGFKVLTSHQMPPHSPLNLIWMDIGPKSPWKSTTP